jgi:amino acid adenylation domain-containing protein
MPRSIIENSNLESHIPFVPAQLPPARLTGPRIEHFSEHPFPRMFEDQVGSNPTKAAVAFENESLSFSELNARANQLARHLRARGVGRDSLVGICIDRSPEMAVGILGILKAGGAYLPLDPEYPTERLAFMLDDARPAVVLTKSNLAKQLPQRFHSEGGDSLVLLDRDWPAISRNSDENLTGGPLPEDLAYVIYTSGSTGEPKGVMITHGNLANYLLALHHELQISAGDQYLHTASIAFSSSRRQLMLPLSQGATVLVATSEQRRDPLALLEMVKQRGVTVMDAVPSFWRNCTAILSGLSTVERERLLDNRLRLMLSASEPLLSDIPQTWRDRFGHPARHVHMFGQTETAGIVCLYRVPEELNTDVSVVPIGNPIANTEIYILDEQQRPCAIGVAGELYIGGAGVGGGYLNRPALTAEKFIPHPFSEREGAQLYRTGDWARLNEQGRIEFAGRRDQQVKLRGFRIELGEVEIALAKHPAVRESVVVARGDGNDEKRLVAYFVANGDAPAAGELRRFLSAQLPDYIVPSAFVQLPALPLSANGKVNRLALPHVDLERSQLSAAYVAPRNEIEERLVAIWSEVLRAARIGVDDNFFELGGHSLLAAKIAARIRKELKVEAPLRVLFERPTIALLAASFGTTPKNLVPRSIELFERNGTAPLSFTQQQFWLLDQAGLNPSVYNVRTAVKIAGALQVERLRQALQTVVARHEVLRTKVSVQDGSPVQIIAPSLPVALPVSDISTLSMSERETAIDRALATEAAEPFDLSKGPLIRARVLKMSTDEHVLLLTIHHIVCDGWSVGVLLRELTAFYQTSNNEQPGVLPRLPIQYADFAMWQRNWLRDETLEQQLSYWKRQLADAPTSLDLPADYSRPANRNSAGGRQSILLPEGLSSAIKMLGRNEKATLFMTMLAAFQTLLFLYTGQDDVVVGSPIAGRTMLETEVLIGAFVNTLVLRGNIGGNPTFREFLARVRQTVLGAFSHQDLPFEKLVEELNPERNINRSPLFQVMFALQNTPAPDLAVDGLTLTPINLQSETAKFDLSLEVEEEADQISVAFEYATDMFAPATVERMLGHYQNLLEAVVAEPDKQVADLSLLTAIERQQLLVEWNSNGADFPKDICIHHLFEAQAARTPDAIAAEFRGEKLTYRELNARANQLAHYLRKQDVGPEVLVGISIERSLEMLVSILSVLKAGGAYVPLDPNYPRERIAFMIEDADLRLVLTQKHVATDIPGDSNQVYIDENWETIARESSENPNINVAATNLAYVIYTSGSTGNPKGVMIEHRSLVNFTQAVTAAYEIKPDDRVLQFASLSFDLSAEEIYPALTTGATVVLRTDEMISTARDFLHYCDEWKISVIDLPTAYWHELTDALSTEGLKLPPSIRLTIIGGEKALRERVIAWQGLVGQNVRLINSYGPTETTVVATMCDLGSQDEIGLSDNVPIGRPIANTTAYVLDEFSKVVPIGVAGELHLGGAGMARGYINRSDLTTQKFVPNPFSDQPNARLYKTGDVVRYRADGNIEFLGRVDNQIKIRGFRVELEEIEQALRNHAGVNDCVVVLREDDDHDKRLVAYIVANGQAQPATSELRNSLKAKLPSYMVPATFEMIAALPLMANGKIDRRALPEPQARRETDEIFAPPRTPIEELLAAAWREVLKLEQIGIHDNFFDLGGHSLLAAKVVSIVRNDLSVDFGMVDVFQAPTIASLAELLYPRAVGEESENELASLLEELASLSDEEAQLRIDHEQRRDEEAAA